MKKGKEKGEAGKSKRLGVESTMSWESTVDYRIIIGAKRALIFVSFSNYPLNFMCPNSQTTRFF